MWLPIIPIKRFEMNELVLTNRAGNWKPTEGLGGGFRQLPNHQKGLVIDAECSEIPELSGLCLRFAAMEG
jgi:hypothetical protein